MPTALITGAGRGIGLALTEALIGRGWTVVASCRRPRGAEALARLAAASPDRLRIEALDVADAVSVADLVTVLDGTPIDALVNNAGVAHRNTPLGALDYDAWRAVLEVNLLAPVRLTEALIDNIAASDQKKVIAISSSLGSITATRGDNYFYRTSKAALNMAMRSLARDLAPRGVTVAMLSPGYVDTDFTRDVGGPKIPVRESGEGLARAIEAMTPADSGRFYRYTGEPIDW
jgi:NAD(P)-dependent dehydrogenase (short-subunit alcohol dehydrogenase family)